MEVSTKSKKNKLLLLCIILVILLQKDVISQTIQSQVIGSAGMNNHTMLDWTVGELAVYSHQNLTEGFHQGNLEVISSITYLPDIDVTIFPNPTAHHIQIEHDYNKELNAVILDALGNKIISTIVKGRQESIDMSRFISGQYYLVLYDQNTRVHLSKVTKI